MSVLSQKFGKLPLLKKLSSYSLVQRRNVCNLKKILAEKIPKHIEKVKEFRKQYGKNKVCEVNLNMVYGGMRGIIALAWETSVIDPDEGITFRGYTIPECQKCLPTAEGGDQPLPEGIFWLLLTGEFPTPEEVKSISKEWAERACIPDHVKFILRNLPKKVHPMSQFAAAITAMNCESVFAKAYAMGVKKTTYWEYVYEDSMNLIARLPSVAAMIYRKSFKDENIEPCIDMNKDWSYNFAKLLGYDDPEFTEFLRLHLTIHCDHEGGNVSAHATHLVGSALSDPYLSFAAGLNGLAGPLHGLANQEVLTWVMKCRKELGDDISDEKLKDFINRTLKSGQVIPGYGHAILRKTDPRYMCQREFALKYMPDDPIFKLVSALYTVVPPILKELGKVQNPWPNVDAHSGVIINHYGMTEMTFYTALFGVSRAIGLLAQMIWSRAMVLPIERPKSLSTEKLMQKLCS